MICWFYVFSEEEGGVRNWLEVLDIEELNWFYVFFEEEIIGERLVRNYRYMSCNLEMYF